ncbi:MAG: PQQ-binding-like beta-propeller repeat protein [Muribaculaceae bacterium]|nr:PQQ-binding-like beta-propeller repeat protein [Muribaculaceae bacterium]
MKKQRFLLLLAMAALALAMQAGVIRLAILSDVHVSPGNANEGKLREAVAEINATPGLDAVLMTGDLTNEGSDVQLRHVKSILDGITASPLYVLPGNHENNWSQSACLTFNSLWGSDRFAFTVDSLVVVGLNCGPFMKMGDGHIKQEDLHWLDSTLRASVKPGMRVLSVNHYPILDDLDNYRAYVEILKRYPVVTHQCGHYHRWRLYETDGINGVMVRALDMGGGNYGYTLMDVDLTAGWIRVWDKVIGRGRELMFAYRINLEFAAPRERQEADVVPEGFDIRRLVADEASIFTRAAVDGECVYYGNSLGWCKAVDKRTGALRWRHDTGSGMLFSRPAVGGGRVVVPTSDHRLLWLDRRSGRRLWEHRDAGPYVADGVVAPDGILYQGGYRTFQAWDMRRHRLLWRCDSIGNYCQAAPVVDGGDVIFGAWDTRLRCLDCRTGALRWQWSNGSAATLYSPGNVVPVVTPSRVVIVAPDRVTTAIDRATGTQLWRVKNEHRVRESLGSSADGTVAYAKTMDGTLVAMSTTGEDYWLLWTVDLGMGYEHAPCIVVEQDGLIYCGSRRGVLAVVDAASHELLFTYRLGSSEVNGLETDSTTGDIFCSLIEGTIWRISPPRRR